MQRHTLLPADLPLSGARRRFAANPLRKPHCSSKMGANMGVSHAAYVFVMWPASRRTVMLPTTEGHVSVQKNGRVSTNWKPAVSTADRTAEWRSGKIWNASAAGTVHFDASERLSWRQARGSSPTYGVSCR